MVLENFSENTIASQGGLRWCDLRDTLNAHGGTVTNFFQDAFMDGTVAFDAPLPSFHYAPTCTLSSTTYIANNYTGSSAPTNGTLVNISFGSWDGTSAATTYDLTNKNLSVSNVSKLIEGLTTANNTLYYSFRLNTSTNRYVCCGIRNKKYYPNNNINMWEKYKPFKNLAIDFNSTQERRNAAIAACYGISSPTGDDALNFITVINSQSDIYKWKYDRPTNIYPLRICDFIDCVFPNNEAIPPAHVDINKVIINTAWQSGGGSFTIISNTQRSDYIGFTDLFNAIDSSTNKQIGNYYLGCIFQNSNGINYIKTSSQTLRNSQTYSVYIDRNDFTSVNQQPINTYMFLCENLQNVKTDVNDYDGKIIKIPLDIQSTQKVTLEIRDDIAISILFEEVCLTLTGIYQTFSDTEINTFETDFEGHAFFKVKINNYSGGIRTFSTSNLNIKVTPSIRGKELYPSSPKDSGWIVPVIYNSEKTFIGNQITLLQGDNYFYFDVPATYNGILSYVEGISDNIENSVSRTEILCTAQINQFGRWNNVSVANNKFYACYNG